MFRVIRPLTHSLISRLIVLVGAVLFLSIFTWAVYNIRYQKKVMVDNIVEQGDRLGNTIRLGTHYSMMLNSREDINEIIKNIGQQEAIRTIRIFNKQGQIKFSKVPEEVDHMTSIKDEACVICHRTEVPATEVTVSERTRIFDSSSGHRLIGVISPIYNEPGCSSGSCHVHPADKKVLGALDVVMSLESTDRAIRNYEERVITLAAVELIATATIIWLFLWCFVNLPIRKLIGWTRRMSQGEFHAELTPRWDDEIGELTVAINRMASRIGEKQEELNRQKNEYQELFEMVPCYVTVIDRSFRLLRYNREFTRHFAPTEGDFCFEVFKGRSEPCNPCPVMKTFEDGEVHSSEEQGVMADGSAGSWVAKTSPVRDSSGGVHSVMEICLDVTQMKRLEEEIRISEQKYKDIFKNIPNPVFVLDRDTLVVLDCNDSVLPVYGYEKSEMLGRSFIELFDRADQRDYERDIPSTDSLTHTRQFRKDGKLIYVNLRLSPTEYLGKESLLVTASDVTKRLLAEQQLIQTSKMATLGEMATGIAHELNQPLAVIKTASSFMAKKIRKGEQIRENILQTMTEEIDNHVDRASKIINHLREFGRKSEVWKEKVNVNLALEKAMELFSQQLRLREILVIFDLDENLPPIRANANRLEQVFINLIINARDAIEDRMERALGEKNFERSITLRTRLEGDMIRIEVKDTGTGIPQSVLDKIFEPFFTTKRVGKGTGLGLSISYGIVQDYSGTIQVDTQEGIGSNFILQFPVTGEI